MYSFKSIINNSRRTMGLVVCATTVYSAVAGTIGSKIDDFEASKKNSLGVERQYIDDTAAGGKTKVAHRVEDGVLHAKGVIEPPRGQPGWVSIVLPLGPEGAPQDASAHEGIRLRVRVNEGNLSISANSSEIDNFDYHASTLAVRPDGKFHEIKIPFKKMKRGWSAPTRLNLKTLTSLSITAYGLQKGAFDFAVDEVSFY